MSLRERIEQFYGTNDADIAHAIQLRHKFAPHCFSIPETLLNVDHHDNLDDYLRAQRPAPHTINLHDIVIDKHLLKPNETRRNKITSILNVGGSVLSLDWQGDYLAVSLLNNRKPIDLDAIADLNAEMGLLFVYKVVDGNVELLSQSHTPLILKLKFHPLKRKILALTKNKVFELDLNLLKPTIEPQSLHLPDLGQPTAIAWQSPHKILIGYANGLVSSTLNNKVLFVCRMHNSLVADLCSAYPQQEEIILSTGVDGNLTKINLQNINNKQFSMRLKFYSPFVKYQPMTGFVCTNDLYNSKVVSKVNINNEQILTKHDAQIMSCGVSNDHPLVVTGSQNGSLRLANAIRLTTLFGKKQMHAETGLWKLECSELEGAYRFVDDVVGAKKLSVFPVSVCVTACAWSSTWVAGGTAGGVIRFDNVDQ